MLLDRLSSANCLQAFCEPATEEASFWDDGHANRLVAVCGVRSEHWQAWPSTSATSKAMLADSCVCFEACFLKPASAPDAQHKDSTSLIDPCEACSKWNPSWKTSVWPWPLYCSVEVFTGPLGSENPRSDLRPERVRVQNFYECLGHRSGSGSGSGLAASGLG